MLDLDVDSGYIYICVYTEDSQTIYYSEIFQIK